jgi:hypothetical protein
MDKNDIHINMKTCELYEAYLAGGIKINKKNLRQLRNFIIDRELRAFIKGEAVLSALNIDLEEDLKQGLKNEVLNTYHEMLS